jgi:hypothetical protein
MNLNRIVNMVVALVLRRFINMGISKAMLFFRRKRTPASPVQSDPDALPGEVPVALRQVQASSAAAALPSPPPPPTGVRATAPPAPEARAARRARQLARRAAKRANDG